MKTRPGQAVQPGGNVGGESVFRDGHGSFGDFGRFTVTRRPQLRFISRRGDNFLRMRFTRTFAPCGPWLVTKDEIPDPHSLPIELRVNGEVRQSSNTNDLIFNVPRIIEFVSQDLTLKPGDIISTGTPSGVGVYRQPPVFLKGGEKIEITIGQIGVLTNSVVVP